MNRRITELGLCLLASYSAGPILNSRTGSLYKRLEKAVSNDLARHSKISWHDEQRIKKNLEKFLLDLGWMNNKKLSGTVLSFVADMLERSPEAHSPKILETINLIIDHLEAGGHLKRISCWAGTVACDKWEAIING